MSEPETQPLLSGDQPQAEQAAPSSRQMPADPAALEREQSYEVGAQRVITWTLWLLLAAVIIGTIIGVVLVSVPMQRGHAPPAARKSAALVVLHQVKHDQLDSRLRLSHLVKQDKPRGNSENTKLLVWSGKGHHKTLIFDDLYLFDLHTKRWTMIYDVSEDGEGDKEDLPIPRWKALALYEPARNDLLVFGGDPAGARDTGNKYLGDLWRLDGSDLQAPVWQKANDSALRGTGAAPSARRAHAGVILEVGGESTLAIHGGRDKPGDLLGDVWATSLEANEVDWRCLFDPEALEAVGLNKKKKHKAKEAPLPRKGHVAISLPDKKKPLMVIWGGRNSTAYFNDMWAFDFASQEWEQWAANSSEVPSGRDHLGGFHTNGTIYIYGGRGGDFYGDSVPMGDMWAFNVAAQSWSEVNVTGTKPLPRFLYSMDSYSMNISSGSGTDSMTATDTRLVVFGGESLKQCYMNDLWEFSVLNSTWELKSALEPDQQGKCAKLITA